MDGRHIPVERLKAFMLGIDQLSEEEHAHIIRCEECAVRMAQSVLDDMETPEEPV